MHATTLRARASKVEERDRLIAEMEAELGLASQHSEDLDVIGARLVFLCAALTPVRRRSSPTSRRARRAGRASASWPLSYVEGRGGADGRSALRALRTARPTV